MSRNHQSVNRAPFMLVMTLAAIIFSSCYSYRISTHAQAGTEVSSVNANSYLWGLVQKPKSLTTPNCDSLGINGMAEVKVKTNVGFALITIATLGIWCPMKIEWRCGKPCKVTDTL